jgi:hypothetical protein
MMAKAIVEAQLGTPYDLSGDIISNIHGEYGFMDTDYLSRVAVPGTLEFTLKDPDHKYTFGLATTLPGWKKGVRINASVVHAGVRLVQFSGFLYDIEPSEIIFSLPTVKVRVTDWMMHVSNFPLDKLQMLTNARIEDGVASILTKLHIQPAKTSFGQGADVLPTIFDATLSNTSAMTEFQRLALSEFGYIYIRMNRDGGETLVVEGRGERTFRKARARFPAALDTLLLANDDTFVLANGDTFGVASTKEVPLLSWERIEETSGTNILNRISALAYPRRIDSVDKTLFTLQQPLFLPAGATQRNIKGHYVDPDGGGTVVTANPATMVPIAPTTHYQMFQNENSTGANLTANLLIDYTFGVEGITFNSIQNTSGTDAWVTKLIAVGRGTYIYEPLEYVNDDNFADDFDVYALRLDQKYQARLETGASLADMLAERESVERALVRKTYFKAGVNEDNMNAFLHLGIGDLVPVYIPATGIAGDYIISRKEFDIDLAGNIDFAFEYVEFLPLVSAYWTLEEVGYGELGETTYIGL